MALLIGPFDKITDSNDDPASGALIYWYANGTTTPIDVFSDAALTIPATNPVECNSAGVAPTRYAETGIYRVRVTTAAGAEIITVDDYQVGGAGGETILASVGMTREVATTFAFSDAVSAVQTTGYSSAGDGGAALYKRAASEPSHAGKFQDANDDWWEIADDSAAMEAFGAVGDGGTDDATAFSNAAGWAVATGGVLLGRRGATYKIASTISIAAGARFRGDGGSISFTSVTASAPIFDFATGAEGVEVSGWQVSFARNSQILVQTSIVDGLLVEGNRISNGVLCWPRGDAPTTEADMAANVVIRGNICTGENEAPDDGDLAVIRLTYIRDAVVSGNVITNYYAVDADKWTGIRWWGGDANPSTGDGARGSDRWARRISITGNVVRGVYAGGIWGSQGRDIAITGNTVEECGDIGIHGEGSDGITVTGNTMRNCGNGGFSPYFIEERAVYSSNSVVITDAATWGVTMLRQNMNTAEEDFDILISGNVFEMQDPGYTGVIVMTRGGDITFEGNTLRNVRIDSQNSNSGDRAILKNKLLFSRDPEAHGIEVGYSLNPSSDREAGTRVEGNEIVAWGWNGTSLYGAISVYHEGANGNARPWAEIRGNTIRGWRDSGDSYSPKGFMADILTEIGGSGFARTLIEGNVLWRGRIWDITHNTSGLAAASYQSRVLHRGNLSSQPGRRTPYDSAPVDGIYWRGSEGLYNLPTAGAYRGWIALGSTEITGGTSGSYSSGADYDVGEHRTGSDSKIYLAVAANGPASSVVDPTTDDGTTWRRVAPAAATFKGNGSVES
tara:strand:- start:10719 stop:13088 length:2370 start_codon:yes stop_codon:yes gene_type:complete